MTPEQRQTERTNWLLLPVVAVLSPFLMLYWVFTAIFWGVYRMITGR